MITQIDTTKVKLLYPPFEDGSFSCSGSYQPMIDSFGEVVLQKDDNDYQGDTRAILKKKNHYGLLVFGWGSCSGCDALQACDSYEDLENMRVDLEGRIQWQTPRQLLKYFREHDWKGDYAHDPGFVQEGIELLEKLVTKTPNTKEK